MLCVNNILQSMQSFNIWPGSITQFSGRLKTEKEVLDTVPARFNNPVSELVKVRQTRKEVLDTVPGQIERAYMSDFDFLRMYVCIVCMCVCMMYSMHVRMYDV